MANQAGYDEHGDTDRGLHETGHVKPPSSCDVRQFGPTSVGEQFARGGWTRNETPLSNDGLAVLPVSKFRTGMAGADGRYNTAAEQPGGA